jgi:hypothetical protein
VYFAPTYQADAEAVAGAVGQRSSIIRAKPAATLGSATGGASQRAKIADVVIVLGTNTPATVSCSPWPGIVGGNRSTSTKQEGVSISSDFRGWHLRSNNRTVVYVKVSASAEIRVTKKGGATTSDDAGRVITLTLPAGDGRVGPDLDVPCAVSAITFDVTADGAEVPASRIELGDAGTASSNPLTFTRSTP